VDLSAEEEATVLATLDPISAMAKTDKGKLKSILEIAKSQNDNMRQLLESMKMKAGQMPFPRPEPRAFEPVETEIQVGQIFAVGKHRVMCGDSLNKDDVKALLGEEIPSLVFTSPPYNAGVTPTDQKYGRGSKYANDEDNANHGEFTKFLNDFTSIWLRSCVYLFVNVQSVAGNKISLIEWLHTWKFNLADEIVWDKQWAPPAMSDNVLDSQFEKIYIFKEETPANRRIGTKKFRGVIKNVYSAPYQKNNEFSGQHNATFPMHLPTFIISTFSNVGECIADPFLGTGTTLISCEENGRVCFGMDNDPGYVELSITRWEEATGKRRELIG
jgi:site-specific DNA-methyltransferase (adenine-specific)/modification methylase